jgi:hypothetical protein
LRVTYESRKKEAATAECRRSAFVGQANSISRGP